MPPRGRGAWYRRRQQQKAAPVVEQKVEPAARGGGADVFEFEDEVIPSWDFGSESSGLTFSSPEPDYTDAATIVEPVTQEPVSIVDDTFEEVTLAPQADPATVDLTADDPPQSPHQDADGSPWEIQDPIIEDPLTEIVASEGRDVEAEQVAASDLGRDLHKEGEGAYSDAGTGIVSTDDFEKVYSDHVTGDNVEPLSAFDPEPIPEPEPEPETVIADVTARPNPGGNVQTDKVRSYGPEPEPATPLYTPPEGMPEHLIPGWMAWKTWHEQNQTTEPAVEIIEAPEVEEVIPSWEAPELNEVVEDYATVDLTDDVAEPEPTQLQVPTETVIVEPEPEPEVTTIDLTDETPEPEPEVIDIIEEVIPGWEAPEEVIAEAVLVDEDESPMDPLIGGAEPVEDTPQEPVIEAPEPEPVIPSWEVPDVDPEPEPAINEAIPSWEPPELVEIESDPVVEPDPVVPPWEAPSEVEPVEEDESAWDGAIGGDEEPSDFITLDDEDESTLEPEVGGDETPADYLTLDDEDESPIDAPVGGDEDEATLVDEAELEEAWAALGDEPESDDEPEDDLDFDVIPGWEAPGTDLYDEPAVVDGVTVLDDVVLDTAESDPVIDLTLEDEDESPMDPPIGGSEDESDYDEPPVNEDGAIQLEDIVLEPGDTDSDYAFVDLTHDGEDESPMDPPIGGDEDATDFITVDDEDESTLEPPIGGDEDAADAITWDDEDESPMTPEIGGDEDATDFITWNDEDESEWDGHVGGHEDGETWDYDIDEDSTEEEVDQAIEEIEDEIAATDDPKILEELYKRRLRLLAFRRTNTILTGPLGLLDDPETKRANLLGIT